MKISGSSSGGDGGGINTDLPKGILKTANNNELFFTYIKDLKVSFNNISQLRADVSENYKEFSSKKLSPDRLEVLDVTLQSILNDLESIEDLIFVENQLKKYSEAFLKIYNPVNNNPYASFVDFFEKGLTMVTEKINIKEEQLLENNSELPVFKVSDFSINEKQKNANIQLKMVALGQGVRVLKTPIDDPSIKITNPRAVAWFGYQNQPRKGNRYFASLLTYTPRLSMPTFEALQKCITDKDPAKTAKRQGTGCDHAAKTGSSKGMQADNKITRPRTSNIINIDAEDFPDTDNKTNLPSKYTAIVQTAKEEQPELLTKDSAKNPQSPVPKEKEAIPHREQASLSNNLNPMVSPHSQNTTQTRPTVTPEKPIENSKQAFPKKPTLEEFLKELEKLLDEMKKLSSGTAEKITADSEKTQDSKLLRKLKLDRFIQQQLIRKDPCNAEKDIHQRLEKIKALHDSLQSTKLETNDVNEALKWLSNTIEDLTQAEKKAAEKCAKFQRTFDTVNS